MEHVCGSEEEDVVNIACSKRQLCGIAPGEGGEGAEKAVFPEECNRAA